MKYILLIGLALLSSGLQAQLNDSTNIQFDSAAIQIDSIKLSLETKKKVYQNQIDSLKSIIDKDKIKDLLSVDSLGLDSVKMRFERLTSNTQKTIDSLNLLIDQTNSSLQDLPDKPGQVLNNWQTKSRNWLRQKQDSSSVYQLKDTLSNKLANGKRKVTDFQSRIEKYPERLQDSIRQKAERKIAQIKSKGKKTDSVQAALSNKRGQLAAKVDTQNKKLNDLSGLPQEKINKVNLEGKVGKIASKAKIDQPLDANAIAEKSKLDGIDLSNTIDKKGKIGKVMEKGNGELELPLGEKVNMDKLNIPTIDNANVNTDGLNQIVKKGTESLDLPVNTNDMPTVDVSELNIDASDKLKDVKLDKLKEINADKLNDLDLTDKLKEKTEDISDINLDEKVGKPMSKIKEVTDNPLEKMGDIEGLEKASTSVEKVGELGKEVNQYSDEIQAVKEGDFEKLESTALQKVDGMEEIHELKKQTALLEQMKAEQIEQYKKYRELKDKEEFKAELEKKLKEGVTNHFSEHADKLAKGQQMLSDAKKKYEALPSFKAEDSGSKTNLINRFQVGFDGEVINLLDGNYFDFSPFIGFRINKKLTASAGYIMRTGVDFDKGVKFKSNPVSGLRLSSNYVVFKGFSVTAIYERVKHLPHRTDVVYDSRIWKNQYLVGVYKKYKIYKGVYGKADVLYNLSHSPDSPYSQKVNMRFGFFYTLGE